MSPHNDGLFSYRQRVSQPMAKLLADPFSELTRKRHTSLLIAATVTLLLSFGLATVTKVGVAGSDFTLNSPQDTKWLAVTVTLYLVVVYLFGVRADWVIAKANHWSPLASIEDVRSTMIADKKALARWQENQHQKLESLKSERSKIKAEFQPKLDTIFAQMENTADKHQTVLKSSGVRTEESKSLMNQLTELHLSYNTTRDELENRLDPIQRKIRELSEDISRDDRILFWWKEKMDIDPTFQTFSRLTQFRLWLEIVFPATYAVFAIIWTILH